MKYIFAAVALATVASAQTISDIPSCAIPCLDDAITSKTSCSTTDVTCICENFSTIQSAATSCIISKCGASEAVNKVLPATEALCKAQSTASTSTAATSAVASSAVSSTETSAAAVTTSAAASTTTSGITSTAASTTSTLAESSSAATASPSASSSSSSLSGSGLSSGAKAGIGVGVSLGVLAGLGGPIYWFIRRRRQRPAPVTPGNETGGPQNKYQLPTNQRAVHEMGGDMQHAIELDAGPGHISELPG